MANKKKAPVMKATITTRLPAEVKRKLDRKYTGKELAEKSRSFYKTLSEC